MKFRFGWRKVLKEQKLIYDGVNDDNQTNEPGYLPSANNDPNVIIVNGVTGNEVDTTTRIVFFGDNEEAGNLYSLFLRSKGYEVYHFPAPVTCALIMQKLCTCPRNNVCADIIIAELDLEGLTALELFRQQEANGCHALIKNKAIIASKFTNRQEYEIKAQGYKILRKPFRLLDMIDWIRECEKSIAPDRRLTPINELLEAA